MRDFGFGSFHIDEPELSFGDGKRYPDPKLGLWAYGPCMYPSRKLSSLIKVGIVGSGETIDLTRQWIDRCQTDIPGKADPPNLFPTFPGFSRVFGSHLHILDECIEVITQAEIDSVTAVSDFYRRVRRAAGLFVSRLSNFTMREPRPNVVVCAIPQPIINRCSVASKFVPATPRVREVWQFSIEPFLFGEDSSEITEARDLRCLMKAKAMELGIPIQLVKPRTLKPRPQDTNIQPEATRAWNFSVGLYYKAEGYPWKLAEMERGTCYVGITFYKELLGQSLKTSMAQVFTHTGEGLILRGARATRDVVTRQPRLSGEDAKQLMEDAIELYKLNMNQAEPTRLVVHKSSNYSKEELQGFINGANEIERKDFVALQDRGVRFVRERGKYPPLRGTAIKIGENDYVLFTMGYINLFETYPGHRVPTPIEITEHHGDSSIHDICKEILALSKMNWNSADFCIREPITLNYSREVGRILAYVPQEVIPRPDYRYYM